MKRKKSKVNKPRDFNKLLSLRGEIDLRTKSESRDKKRFSRKKKHKHKDN